MKKDDFITEVVFRRFPEDNAIIALFPYEIYNGRGGINSYMHIGQHGEAEYSACVKNASLAKESEYADLKSELESLGYNLKVIKRRNYNRYLTAQEEWPELDTASKIVANIALNEINKISEHITSKCPYKAQCILEMTIKRLEDKV